MKKIKLKMINDNLNIIPEKPLPNGYSLSFYKKGDHVSWAQIETEAGEFDNFDLALERFENEFKTYQDLLHKRCLFLINEKGQKIGTIMAWQGNLRNKLEGRIHWVSIIPEYQGKDLSKPMLAAALEILQIHYESAYLTTYTTNYKAINLYLQFGFKPYIENGLEHEGWKLVGELLDKKLI